MGKKIEVIVNGVSVTVPEGTTVLEATKIAGYRVPTLCYLKSVNCDASCRVCVVEVEGARNLVAACSTVAFNKMKIATASERVKKSRKTTIELILSNHEKNCLSCKRNTNCELQKLSLEYNCNEEEFAGARPKFTQDEHSPLVKRDNNKCILCRRCTSACSEVQSVGVISATGRGFTTAIGSAFDKSLESTPCVLCGQCVVVCPTAALSSTSVSDKVKGWLEDDSLHTVVGIAPAVRTAIGEAFGLDSGKNTLGQIVAALKRLKFDAVFDISMVADFTIMEEGAEFLDRLKNNNLPLFTSCSPGWVRFMEFNYPEMLNKLSTAKSPQQMFGAIIKSYYAEKLKIDKKKIRVVTIMPCIAKKSEAAKGGNKEVDAVLTTDELAFFIKQEGIDFVSLKPEKLSVPLAEFSGAGVIFGSSGGVAEAALRTIIETKTNKKLEKLDLVTCRGVKAIKETTVKIGDKEVKVAVVSGLRSAREVVEKVKAGKCDYDFIEVMACPGGCVNGGGQPVRPASLRNFVDLSTKRAKDLYACDKACKVRRSHESPIVKTVYQEYLQSPGSKKAHELLHR